MSGSYDIDVERSVGFQGFAPAAQLGPTALQVHIVAPALVCWGLQRLVQSAGPLYALAGCSWTMAEVMTSLERSMPDVLVLDLDDGYDMQDLGELHARHRVKILALTSSRDVEYLTAVLESGARGVLHMREAPSALLRAIEVVGAGHVFATKTETERLFVAAAKTAVQRKPDVHAAGRIATLTVRERQALAAVTSDTAAPVKVIASRLCISEHTLRNHLTSIYSKLAVSSRLELYAFATGHNLHSSQGAEG